MAELERKHAQIEELRGTASGGHEEPNGARREDGIQNQELLALSQTRWRGDEPDAGLTWGVPMSGDEFVGAMMKHFAFEGSTIVEIGPGYGRILRALLQRSAPFRRYIGLEISGTRVDRLRDQFRDDSRIEFRQADVLGFLDLNATADLIFSSAVFEHLYPHFGPGLETLSRFTRLGGLAIIDFIRDDHAPEKSAAWFEGETYMRTYSTSELNTIFNSSHFRIEHTGRISFGLDILHREITRTIVVASKTRSTADIEQPDSLTVSNVKPFDLIVNRPLPQCDPHTVEPPEIPKFRSPFGGFWTDLSNADAILAGKLALREVSQTEASLLDAWRQNGFVILPGAVDEAAIDAALNDFERAYDGELQTKVSYWDDDGHHIEPAQRTLRREKEAKLLDIYTVSEATQAIQFAPRLSRFLHILFERPPLAFQSLSFYYGSQQHLHQDTAFVRVSSPMEFVASWIALEDIQEGSGELQYYVGSHALPEYLFGGKHLWAKPDDPELGLFSSRLVARAEASGLRLERFLPRKGDALIWSAALMHGGCIVQSDSTRKSLVTHYCPADVQPMYAYKGGRQKRKSVAGNYIMGENWE